MLNLVEEPSARQEKNCTAVTGKVKSCNGTYGNNGWLGLATIRASGSHIGAADALEKRAEAIHEWPIDQATFAWVLTITTSVLAMTIGRLILDPLGL